MLICSSSHWKLFICQELLLDSDAALPVKCAMHSMALQVMHNPLALQDRLRLENVSAQGTGQKVGGLVANHGDGLATDATVLKSFGGALSDPNPFFRQLLRRPYLNQVGSTLLFRRLPS